MRRLGIFWVLLALAACSSGTTRSSVHGNWQVMTHGSGTGMLCYAGAGPISSTGTAARDGQPYIMITRRLSGKMEVSVSAGYTYKPSGRPLLLTDGKHHRLFSRGSVAWAKTDASDAEIIRDMKAAKSIELRGLSQAGGSSVDTYSSTGLAEALTQVRKLCP